ncbi:hypothetical protein BGS_1186 [Beggiatoa sp. SS]|nr:hypothetical protein BGS_1186 [Beggiatoa sp. SS]
MAGIRCLKNLNGTHPLSQGGRMSTWIPQYGWFVFLIPGTRITGNQSNPGGYPSCLFFLWLFKCPRPILIVLAPLKTTAAGFFIPPLNPNLAFFKRGPPPGYPI